MRASNGVQRPPSAKHAAGEYVIRYQHYDPNRGKHQQSTPSGTHMYVIMPPHITQESGRR
jgi:hypothetical protein